MFEQGTLWDRVKLVTARALDQGVLEPIDTDFTFVQDGGVPFLVRIVSKLARKPRADSARNPFLPYEKALHVADASPTHVCVLNKYNVLDHHLLIVTREFQDQKSPLNLHDFLALWRCMSEYNSLGFYNCGTISGASQPHKHLQVVPLPFSAHGDCASMPIEPLLETSQADLGKVVTLPSLPFAHALVRWDFRRWKNPQEAADESLARYRTMWRRVSAARGASKRGGANASYNLIVTRRWMMLVPRTSECFESISFNSLAFVGALLVHNETQMKRLQAVGPCAALEHVAGRAEV